MKAKVRPDRERALVGVGGGEDIILPAINQAKFYK